MAKDFIISLPTVYIPCKHTLKDGLRLNCPLKQFLDSDEAIYVAWPQDNRLLPDTTDFQTAVNEMEKIRKICDNCKNQHKGINR